MAYLPGSMEAVDFYCKAFNASAKNCFKANDGDNFYAHAEIVINNKTVLAISDILTIKDTPRYIADFERKNNMQFWLNFDDEQSLTAAYHALKEKAQIHCPLAPCEWCSQMTDLTDKFGIRWLLTYGH